MSARDVIAKAILDAGMSMGALAHRSAKSFEDKIVDFQIEALTASGHRILAPGEAQIIENALRYAREAMTVAGGMPLSDAETIDAIDAALRSLLKEHGNDE